LTANPSSLPSALSEPAKVKGTHPYDIVRRIGSGGMGVVYEAIDERTGQHVALKTLLTFGAASLYRFKQEFRTLADVHHRNLVQLHELVVTGTEPAFFTMELVDGISFLAYAMAVDGAAVDVTPTTDRATPGKRLSSVRGSQPAPPSVHPEGPRAKLDRLRPALRQLVEGLDALHRVGKLHRDVKPSNVLVTPAGRVVLLDFGVATDLPRAGASSDDAAGEVVGTPLYMSPEQATGEAATAASDLYSVGVMLYEALVGRPPFAGTSLDVIARKSMLTPTPPGECVAGVPRDLDELCTGLLQIDPAKRPTAGDVLRLLGSTHRSPSAPPGRRSGGVLIGREGEQRALHAALDAAHAGQSVTVRVSGASGMGKSALVAAFVGDLVADGRTNVLAGRAYERESVPYKACDGVVDALSQLLVALDADGSDFVLPRQVGALARLFPVLRRVPGIEQADDSPDADPQAERRRAFRALRECLTSLAQRRPLVVFIDDVQWGDVDSVALLVEVMRPPNAPPLLLVMTSREEDAEGSPFLGELAASWPAPVSEVRVGPLDAADAHRLALSLLAASDASAERTASAIVREALGSPLLIEELVRSHRHDGTGAGLVAVTLDAMVARRLADLPPVARRLAEAVAVAGRPLPVATFGLENEVAEALMLLQTQGLARVGFRGNYEVAEPVHDRLRETVVAQLSPHKLREHHGRLAAALEATAGADLEAVALHMLGAGKSEQAAEFAERAAEQAASKLAFDQASRLLRTALDTATGSGDHARRLRVRLAGILARAGRASAAADEYAKAAMAATAMERIELERAAAEQLLACGRIDEGKAALHRVLEAIGMTAPRSAVAAVILLLFYRLRLALRGLNVREREAADVSSEDRVRIDALGAVSAGLGTVDVILGACMHAKHLLVALDRGDRAQVFRALGVEIVQVAAAGRRESARERRLLGMSRALAVRVGGEADSHFGAWLGLALYMRGRYREALETFDAVPSGEGSVIPRLFAVYCCFFLGKLREERRRARRLLRDVEERGDVYTAVSLRTTVMVDIALVDDDPEAAMRHLRQAMARWSQSGFHVQHWYAMWAEANVDLYAGDGARARARLERDARALRRSMLLHSQMIRGFTAYLRGCCAVASIAATPALRGARVGEARTMARQLRQERAAWAPTLAAIVHAAAANAAGARDEAIASLREALGHAEAADLALHGWAARYQLGKAVGGTEGGELVASAERAMSDEGVRAPPRMAALIVPGTWDESGARASSASERVYSAGATDASG
jgi:serine/threonine protein kinase/tetratricopeptide (TPR) repeat protein